MPISGVARHSNRVLCSRVELPSRPQPPHDGGDGGDRHTGGHEDHDALQLGDEHAVRQLLRAACELELRRLEGLRRHLLALQRDDLVADRVIEQVSADDALEP